MQKWARPKLLCILLAFRRTLAENEKITFFSEEPFSNWILHFEVEKNTIRYQILPRKNIFLGRKK